MLTIATVIQQPASHALSWVELLWHYQENQIITVCYAPRLVELKSESSCIHEWSRQQGFIVFSTSYLFQCIVHIKSSAATAVILRCLQPRHPRGCPQVNFELPKNGTVLVRHP